jgi:hypothetical protein
MDDELCCAKCAKQEEDLHGVNILKYTPCGHRLYVCGHIGGLVATEPATLRFVMVGAVARTVNCASFVGGRRCAVRRLVVESFIPERT